MQALGKFFRQEGLYTFVRWNTFFTNPPLCITEAEMREAFAIIDKGLEITDQAVQLVPEPNSFCVDSVQRLTEETECVRYST